MNDHTGHPLTSLSNLPRDSYDQEQQDRLTALRSELAAAEAERADLRSRLDGAEAGRDVWKERAEHAEAELDRLRGEALALREALEWALESGGWRLWYFGANPIPDLISTEKGAGSVGQIRDDLTPRATKLGALVDAALEERRTDLAWTAAFSKGTPEDEMRRLRTICETNRTKRQAAADAVLASEVRT